MKYYRTNVSIADHVGQHSEPLGREFSVVVSLGTQSADFDLAAFAVPLTGYVFRRAYFIVDADLASDGTDYWTLKVYENDTEDRGLKLTEWVGNARSLTAKQPYRLPTTGNVDTPLTEGNSIRIKGTKAGAPSSLTSLTLHLVLALA